MIKRKESKNNINTIEAYAGCYGCLCMDYRCSDNSVHREEQRQKKTKSNYLSGIGYTAG
ncbi:MAG: hypothetical protein HFG96_00435 [Lachnospiraceae bacterium]|jgi:hypothetical protein|nr:hypothetical protein [Lachnospiraceae bacterium]